MPGDFKTFNELCDETDAQLFEKVLLVRDTHVLGQLLREVRDIGHNLRPRSHNLSLPKIINQLDKMNFFTRMLYKNMD